MTDLNKRPGSRFFAMSQPGTPVGPSGAPITTILSAPLAPVDDGDGSRFAMFGQPIYVDGAGVVRLAIATSEAAASAFGLCPAPSVPLNRQASPDVFGVVNWSIAGLMEALLIDGFNEWTWATENGEALSVGYYYLSATAPGKITATPPTEPGTFVMKIGYAISPSKLIIQLDGPPVENVG